ncbi:hypothetical protein N9A28_04130 [Sulfurimonas sp.]|nr:hypothetical protein [Sulfurimonas sp.]
MKSSEDRKNHQTNLMYFNQMVEENEKRNKPHNENAQTNKKARPSFGSQKVDFKDYLLAPEGYESVVYPIYFVLIPYIVGAIVLFFFVAGASLENFKLIEFNNFLIVWMIGYEIVGTMILIAILIAFLQYEDTTHSDRHF